MNDQPAAEQFGFARMLTVIRRRWWMTLLCALVVACAAGAFTMSQPKQYTATATVLLRDQGLDQTDAQSNIALVSSPGVVAGTARALGISADVVAGEVKAAAQGTTNVVYVQATDPDPQMAAKLANAYAQQAVAVRRQTDNAQLLEARSGAQSQLKAMTPSQRTIALGQLVQSQSAGNIQFIAAATAPTAPSAPKLKHNVLYGLVIGLVLGLGAAALAERLDRRIRTPAELSGLYGLPVLTDVGEVRTLKRDRANKVTLQAPDRDALRVLLAKLRYTRKGRQIRSVLVTSAVAREGKSTVSWHVAETAALGSGGRVLLVEADMRAPVFAGRHDLNASPGLGDLLTARVRLAEVVQTVAIEDPGADGPAQAHMDVIVAGEPSIDPMTVIESQAMADLMAKLTEEYDFIVVDTPSLLPVADTMPLVTMIGGVLVVARIGFTTRDDAVMLRDELRGLEAPTLGVIANWPKGDSRKRFGYYADPKAVPSLVANRVEARPESLDEPPLSGSLSSDPAEL